MGGRTKEIVSPYAISEFAWIISGHFYFVSKKVSFLVLFSIFGPSIIKSTVMAVINESNIREHHEKIIRAFETLNYTVFDPKVWIHPKPSFDPGANAMMRIMEERKHLILEYNRLIKKADPQTLRHLLELFEQLNQCIRQFLSL